MSLLLIIAIFFTGTLGADVQWFGNDTFLCHCENKCDHYGNCDNGKCARGWFGYKCQYQDLLAVCDSPTQYDLRKLTDQDNTTCYNNGNEIILTWKKPIRFSWLRIMFKDKANIQKVQLEFSTSDFATGTIPCLNNKTTYNRDEAVDISCEVKELTQRLKVKNSGEICTMCINGGRNIALKQHTSQSSTFENHVSSLAIDGNTTGNLGDGHCSHTNVSDQAPWFEVTFPRSVVFRADVYNRELCCQDRLSNFNLKMFNDSMRTFDISPIGSSLSVYTINFNIDTVANKAVISTKHISADDINPFLTLCGVEIYGECAPGTWGLRCENVCSDRCLNKDCNRDTGECNEGCPGDNNISPMCLLGPWFSSSNLLCHCDSTSPCDSNGNCENNRCALGWFGFKCQYQDLATLDTAKIEISFSTDLNVLIDRDDMTCSRMKNNITITWNTKYPFSWIRLRLADNIIPSEMILTFSANKDATQTDIVCENKKVIQNPDKTVDVRCDLDKPIQKLMITNVENVCSLYVNGGRNLALYQTAYQSSTYSDNNIPYGADKAVDGNRNGYFNAKTCSHTGDISDHPTFNVTFPKALVYRVDIYNRVDKVSDRLSNATLTLYNETTKTFSEKLGNVTNVPLISIYPKFNTISTKVEFNTKYVAAESGNQAFLTLCEVEVFGECAPGTYGLNCDNCDDNCYNKQCNIDTGECGACVPKKWGLKCQGSCSQNCINQTCDRTIGTCNEGCIEGYRSVYCNETCEQGKWGLGCIKPCSSNCLHQTCNATTGTCVDGCKSGYQSYQCNETCLLGKWGPNCLHKCNETCLDQTCDHITGECMKGCIEGYTSKYCNQTCNATMWGRNCANMCNASCNNKHCNSTTGVCTEGCLGYTDPPICSLVCFNHTYGLNCNSICSVNCDSECDTIYGHCPVCNAGYGGDNCSEACLEHHFGKNCNNNCSKDCVNEKCDSKNGTCHECYSGFYGNFCNNTCLFTTWGPRCIHKCNETCLKQNCNGTTGKCVEGCNEGYTSEYCDQTCDEHHYGRNCLLNCSSKCLNQKCQRETGKCNQCIVGYKGDICNETCTVGYFGTMCLEKCSPNCRSSCHHVDGTCLQGCTDGYIGENCTDICDDNTYGLNCTGNCSTNCFVGTNKDDRRCSHVNGNCLKGCVNGFKGSMCSLAMSLDDSSPVGAIVGGIIGVIIVAAVIIAAVLVWRRRKSHKSKASSSENHSLTNLQATKGLHSDDSKDISQDTKESKLDTPDSRDAMDTSIPVHELSRFMETHDTEFFTQQFKKIPAPQNVSTEVAHSEENRSKNRYKNICPYDNSRVNLKINTGKKEGDYINASYIRGFNNQATFIAAQGPNNLVINDFIRMLWEQNVKKVVMLTNLIEEGKVKCEKYWPDKDKVTYGEIEVKLAQTQTFTDYSIRILELSKQSEITHVITQYHFTSWPDQGIPYAPWALIDFSERVFSDLSSDFIVVHCSAGVGRTGTFIALYNILRQAEETNQIDFFKTLSKLREDRTLMIQTADQYIFLHRITQAALACTGSTVSARNIKERLSHLMGREVSGLTRMRKEFQTIDKLCKDIRKSHKEDKENEDVASSTYQNTADLKNIQKNRFPSIFPRNADRPYLTCDSNEDGDYINAVFIPGLKKKDQVILTQLPMPTTVVDFWKLVVQYKVRLVVAFEKDKLATDKTVAVYLPTTKNMALKSMPFEINCDSSQDDELWEEQILSVSHEKSKSNSHSLSHILCKCNDLDGRKLLTLVKKIRSYNVQADGTILYTCKNGATYSGLCCAVSLLLDRMDNDSCASVPLVVGLMKTIRPEVIPSVEQYKLLYDVLERYTDVSNPYSNFDENFYPRSFKQAKVNKSAPGQPAKDNESIYNNL